MRICFYATSETRVKYDRRRAKFFTNEPCSYSEIFYNARSHKNATFTLQQSRLYTHVETATLHACISIYCHVNSFNVPMAVLSVLCK